MYVKIKMKGVYYMDRTSKIEEMMNKYRNLEKNMKMKKIKSKEC